ncbi:MAG: ABC transporter ATP-binding protein, partial [Longimicrobiales bacterium]
MELRKVRYLRSLSFIQGTAVNFLRTSILFFMLYLIYAQQITVGQFFSLWIYSFFIFGPLQELGTVINTYRETEVSLANFDAILRTPKERRPEKPVAIGPVTALAFDSVGFVHQSAASPALSEISFAVSRGETVAFVGPSGAGKTTLVKLLCKLYAPTSGRIVVDGIDLQRLPAAAWRERLAGAFQDFFRFEFKAGHAVGIGDLPRLDDRETVAAAVERAGASGVIEQLPAELDTQLGPTWPDGVELSFGQWQKLALARGFMREEPILLVLDEPTAALDAETEHALFERYAQAARGDQITLLVSHRFSTVRMADTIIVLDGARVVEAGTHEELMVA